MRLWHKDLISKLPRQQLLGQHRECCALRGKGWGKAHSTVNYVFKYSYSKLYHYHMLVIREMKTRGYNVDRQWLNLYYRGKVLDVDYTVDINDLTDYPEHNQDYLQECLDNLKAKGITIEWK